MDFVDQIKQHIFNITDADFEAVALDVFMYQASNNPVYKLYISYLGINPDQVRTLTAIPFLPIDFFKKHTIITGAPLIAKVFESSGTTQQMPSKHHVADVDFYLKVCKQIFESKYGTLGQYAIMALLPSYLERSGSSLIYMISHFIAQSAMPYSGFYLNNIPELLLNIIKAQKAGKKVLLWGVTFALLELAEQYSPDLSGVLVMETGGMKGRREELLREELHQILTKQLNVPTIHSEYGMTELLSQAYSFGNGIFETPPWMRILLREINDPRTLSPKLKRGGINIVDLANIQSCAFIETMDLGAIDENYGFKVEGRFDNSDIRGCNLLVSS